MTTFRPRVVTEVEPIRIGLPDGVQLRGELGIPHAALGIVLFAHGSGSSHRSPRNQAVATALRDRGFATLLFDLLTDDEALDRHNVFDIDLLADRLLIATAWQRDRETTTLPLGYFGASTGAAAALVAAARGRDTVGAVVSRGGRPDLAGRSLRSVRAPTLLIVGGLDEVVIRLNEQARDELGGPVRLEIVRGATHLFPEAGALERVADLAGDWFVHHLAGVSHEDASR